MISLLSKYFRNVSIVCQSAASTSNLFYGPSSYVDKFGAQLKVDGMKDGCSFVSALKGRYILESVCVCMCVFSPDPKAVKLFKSELFIRLLLMCVFSLETSTFKC